VDQEGLVTAKAKGEAIITVTTEDGGKTASCKVTVKEAAAPTIAVTVITLSHSNFTLEIGTTATLIATITPNNASNKKVTWSSNNETVAAVSEEGVVTAKAKGEAIITVTTEDGGKTAQCTVTVQEPAAPGTEGKVTGIKLDWTSLSLLQGTSRFIPGRDRIIFTGGIFQLTATVLPNDATNKKVTWTSSDESVVKVDQTGKLTVIITSSKDEATIITATTEDGAKTATCEVYIHNNIAFPPLASGITLDKTEIKWTHVDHETAQLTATIAPTDSNDKKVIWSSDNALVATVDQNGKVTEMGYGEATIKACASKNRSVFATCTVKSTSPLPPHPPIIIPKP